ncbi:MULTISPECIES: hypothetical protein [unclassified Roseateles]|uniref:hypothetical protein n=1 Tax=unclassified Roseateles TaxID=2626991 RepID=UPI0007019ACA|nr:MULTISPECIES: hypothetical protein [unclassified Roseateles]KQW43338.1 hypothetical protein ASC81_16235 [Pelomonas sp. Root405]KRA71076.1 hypothetical protein ASD88_14755 [Pelomonas sp. Root662]
MTSVILSVAIGVIFVFMLFSLFLSASLEAISATLKLRGRALRVALARLIDDPDTPVQRGGFGLIDRAVALWAGRAAATPAPAAPAVLVADAVDLEAPERHEATLADGDHRPLEPVRFFDVFCHPLVAGASGKSSPSYVPDGHFTSALLHTLLRDKPEASIAAVTERVALLPPGPVRTALEGALLDARGDWNALRAGIDRWYANAMNRLSGEYKRFSQLLTFLLGLALAASFNIDAVALAQQLYADPVLRGQLTAQAEQYVAAQKDAAPPTAVHPASAPDAEARYRQSIDEWVKARDLLTRTVPGASATADMPTLERLRQGWLGWLVTALAGMLGAPFWFDLLQKLTNLRGTGPKPGSATDGK